MNANHEDRQGRAPLLARRTVLFGGGAAAAAGVLAACSSGGGGSAAAPGKKLRIFHVPKFTTLPYFQSAQAGAAQAAKELGDSIVYTGPSSSNAEQQVASLQTVVSQRPDVILLSAIEQDNVAPC